MKILGYTYKLKYSDGMSEMGKFVPNNQTIFVDEKLCHQQILSTILHEIIEALCYHMELKIEHPIMMGLESGLYQVLTDNGVSLEPLLQELLTPNLLPVPTRRSEDNIITDWNDGSLCPACGNPLEDDGECLACGHGCTKDYK